MIVKQAIPLASATVFGGSIANNILNLGKKHPDVPSRPLIDYDLLLTLEPMTIAGALIGAMLNSILPDLLLVICMVVLLSVTAHTSLLKACSLYKKESEALDRQTSINENRPLLTQKDVETQNTFLSGSSEVSSDENEKINEENDTRRVRQQVIQDLLKLSSLFVVVTVLNLLKGAPEDGGGPMALPKCGPGCFWATQTIILIIIVVFCIHVRRNLLARRKNGGPILSDIEWDESNTLSYPGLAILAGLVAGLFGVAGGMVNLPLMLALGKKKSQRKERRGG